MSRWMRPRRRARGQTLVFMALGVVVFLGFVALSIDGGMIFAARRRAQASADAAALAAAYARIKHEDWQQKAWDVASQNGFSASRGDVLQVTCETAAGAVCPSTWNGDEEYVRVAITTRRKTSFAQLLSHSELATTVEAVARVRVDRQPLEPMDAFVSLDPHASPGIKVNGNAYVRILNGGMFSNSDSGSKSIWEIGSASLVIDDGQALRAVGGINAPSCQTASGANCILRTGVEPISREALARKVPRMPSPPACTDRVTAARMERFNGGALNADGKVYCISGSVDLEDITINGHVTFVLSGSRGVSFSGNNEVESLDIFVENGDVKLDDDLHAGHFHVYASGNGDVIVRSGADVHLDDTLFYLHAGRVRYIGTAQSHFCPPPQNDPYGFGGLVEYLETYSGQLHVNGNTDNWIVGTVLAPYAEVVYNGNSDNTSGTLTCHGETISGGYPTQVISGTIRFNGNSYNYINFNKDWFFTVNSPVIELVK